MTDISPIDPPVADLPPISAVHRMELGAIAPWGNPSDLASCMGAAAPAISWHENMSSSKFQCPVCAGGVVTAKSHPTMRGVISMACDRGCASTALREACEACAPRAFRYDANLIPAMTGDIVRALMACANDGTFTAGMAVPMRVITKMRQGAALVTTTQVKAPNGATHILTLRTDYHAGMTETKTFRQFHLVYPIDGAPTVEVGLPEAPWPPVGSDVRVVQFSWRGDRKGALARQT